MNCPFLKETLVRSCAAAPVRMQIRNGMETMGLDKCSTPDYVQCSAYRDRGGNQAANGARCPFLEERLVQFCSVAPVTKFIPYSEASLSRCGSGGFEYCSVYLNFAQPGLASAHSGDERDPVVEGIRVPRRLYYAPNHMWLDVREDGACHVGIDGLLAHALKSVAGVSFATAKGVKRPSAALALDGVTWPLTFPNPLLISSANLYLRRHPNKLVEDPYGEGWLFEGWEAPSAKVREGLLKGSQAAAWMAQEVQRLNEFVHGCTARCEQSLGPLMNDGGAAVADLAGQMQREELLRLLNEFFAPHAAWAHE
jgi:glycine cleavage system H lipoate-binding protein